MSSIAQTQPRTGRRNFTLRAYLAGTAATAALLGAVVLVFASLGAYVAFNGLPIGGDSAASDATSVEVGAAATQTSKNQADQVGAAIHQGRAGAGAGTSGSHQPGAGAGSGDASGADATATASPSSPSAPAGTGSATVSASGSGSTTVSSGPSQGSPSNDSNSPLPTPNVSTPDSVGGTLGTVDQTLHGAGVDVPLSQAGSAVDQVTDGLVGGN